MPAAKRETPRSWPASTGSMTCTISKAGTRTISPGKPGIRDVARVPAQEVVGDTPTDRIELDALPDDVAARQRPHCG